MACRGGGREQGSPPERVGLVCWRWRGASNPQTPDEGWSLQAGLRLRRVPRGGWRGAQRTAASGGQVSPLRMPGVELAMTYSWSLVLLSFNTYMKYLNQEILLCVQVKSRLVVHRKFPLLRFVSSPLRILPEVNCLIVLH